MVLGPIHVLQELRCQRAGSCSQEEGEEPLVSVLGSSLPPEVLWREPHGDL